MFHKFWTTITYEYRIMLSLAGVRFVSHRCGLSTEGIPRRIEISDKDLFVVSTDFEDFILRSNVHTLMS